jgi:PAS domain S-box-containing protein
MLTILDNNKIFKADKNKLEYFSESQSSLASSITNVYLLLLSSLNMSLEGHEQLINNLREAFKNILEKSEQSIYIYINDLDKICNERFAKLLGYASSEEWEMVEENFPTVFVEEGSQHRLITAYRNAMENYVGSAFEVSWRKKDGGSVKSDVILVPIPFEEHIVALHYVSAKRHNSSLASSVY